MKKCLQCEQVYGDDINFCLSDGSTLVPVAGSFTFEDETPTVYGGQKYPPVANTQPMIFNTNQPVQPGFGLPVANPPEPPKSHTLLIVLVVGFFALLVGGAIVGVVMYSLSKKDANVANSSNSASKSNKDATVDHSSDGLAENLKQQQDKIEKDKQKLEDERKALEAKKKQTTPTPAPNVTPVPNAVRTATIIDPPTNIRLSPNGTIICVVRQRTSVNILGSTNVRDNNGTWYYTDACGRTGVVHSSQIRF